MTDDDLEETEAVELLIEFCRWCWEPHVRDEPFDFGSVEFIRRGIDLMKESSRKCRPCQTPTNVFIQRWMFSNLGVLYRLKSQFSAKQVCEKEAKASGWSHRA